MSGSSGIISCREVLIGDMELLGDVWNCSEVHPARLLKLTLLLIVGASLLGHE